MYFLFIIIMFIAAFVTRGNAPVSCVCMVTASIFAIADSIMSLGDKVNKVNESIVKLNDSIFNMFIQYINKSTKDITPNEMRAMFRFKPFECSDSRDEHAPL